MLSWVDTLRDEDFHNGNLIVEWNFEYDSMLTECKVHHSKKETFYYFYDEVNHVHNQTQRIEDNRDRKLWESLLDSQHAWNFITNEAILT